MFPFLRGSLPATGLVPLLALALSTPFAHPQTKTPDAGIINTVAGDGTGGYSGDGGAAVSAELWGPAAIAVDSSGNLYIADQANGLIRKVTVSTGVITTIAGGGTNYGSCEDIGDGGPATDAELNPDGVAVDSAGNVYIADMLCGGIRKVDAATGIITTVAGNGAQYTGGGEATNVGIGEPYAVKVDETGNFYIADYVDCVILKVDVSTGILSAVAGTGTCGYGAPNGTPATTSAIGNPTDVAVDASGNLFIVDPEMDVVYEVKASTGIISILAGNEWEGCSVGDGGPATSAELHYPIGVTVDSYDNVYVTDDSGYNSPCANVREISAATGDISTVAGTGAPGYSGDGGPASSAEVSYPMGLAVDRLNNLYIVDNGNNRVRIAGAASILPAPPSGATSYADTECWGQSGYPGYPNNMTYKKEFWEDWVPFNDGGGGAGSLAMQKAQSTPDTGVCGSLELLDTTTSGELDVQTAENVCGNGTQYTCPSSISDMELDMQFYIPPNTTYQALEFDPDVTWPNSEETEQSYKISVACQFHPNPAISDSPIWVYWDGVSNSWQPFTQLGLETNVACNLAPGRHRLQLYATLDTQDGEYYYNEMVVDGQQPAFNLPSGSGLGPITPCSAANKNGKCYGWGQYIGVEEQTDANHSNSTSTVCRSGSSYTVCTYYDHENLKVW